MIEVKWSSIVKSTFIYTGLVILINLVMATYLTENIERYIHNGILDRVEVSYDAQGKLELKEDGVPITVYNSYEEALVQGADNRFLMAQNGILYKKNVPFGRYTYVLDFTWLPKGVYDLEDIKIYLESNKLAQIIRTSYLSSGLLVFIYIFPLLLIIGYYLLPLVLVILSKIYVDLRVTYSKGDERDHVIAMRRLTQSQFLDRLFQRYEEGADIQVITALYSMMVGMNLGLVGQLMVDVGSIIMGYIGILLLVGMYYTGVEYQRMDANRYLNKDDVGTTKK